MAIAHSHHNLKKFFSSANLTIFLAVILILCLISLGRQTLKYFSIKKEVFGLEQKVEQMEARVELLDRGLENRQDNFYKEREARLKFGLQKPDEKVIIIVLDDVKRSSDLEDNPWYSNNFIRWWDYFFK